MTEISRLDKLRSPRRKRGVGAVLRPGKGARERSPVGGAFPCFPGPASRPDEQARGDAEMPILTGLPKMPARYSQDSQRDYWQFGQMSLAATYLCESVAQLARSFT
ncbi:hypothetical protein C5Y97_12715 [Blastopirellula marina]|uniref:Uncharacterized protein n=1 Tax=Blastopirellula marina TaxID=124 RepID=A0A2S8FWV6_9BACT|nr:hypothetical protein C5Y98_12705 [Blastopirellula marina]PTL44389.1 hypothetical protein C5Y97_12715 [Blastopirellula marina]